MLTKLTLDQLQRDLRTHICPHCPLRPRGGKANRAQADTPCPCEAQCPLFLALPTLARQARLIDPMLRSREQVLCDLIREPVRSASPRRLKPTSAWLLEHYGDEVARLIAGQFSG